MEISDKLSNSLIKSEYERPRNIPSYLNRIKQKSKGTVRNINGFLSRFDTYLVSTYKKPNEIVLKEILELDEESQRRAIFDIMQDYVNHLSEKTNHLSANTISAGYIHLLVYGKVTNTTEFYNKTKWLIKNKGDMKTDVDIFNCVRYLLSHAGVRKKTHVIRYLGDISYRKLKVEKEPQKHFCPYCKLPLTIFFIKDSPKSLKPPIDHVGLWEPDNFFPYYPNDDSYNEEGIPFYELKKDTKDNSDYFERQIYSFEDILYVRINLPKITHRKYELSQTRFVTSLNCQKLETFT